MSIVCIDISDKHTHTYPSDWKKINCPTSMYRNKSGFEGVLSKHGIRNIDVMYIGSSHTLRNITELLLYCDFHRKSYPRVIAIKSLPEREEINTLQALFARGYRVHTTDKVLTELPDYKFLLVYRDNTPFLDKIN